MRVMFLGLRGFPNVQGGVEAHVQNLALRLAARGCEVECIVRAAYQPLENGSHWRGVRFLRVWSPRRRWAEALVHTFLGVLVAAVRRPDVLHIHAIGPAFWTPLARLLGLRVVVTHHGPDYDREKWGQMARAVLRLGERWGARQANGVIAISQTIASLVEAAHHRDTTLIPNGVNLPVLQARSDALAPWGLEPRRYVLLVSRLVPEKRHLDLIEAFRRAAPAGWKLVIVGAADHPDDYIRSVQRAAAETPGVVMTGFQSGEALQQLYTHAGLFVLPSTHEGLPIALLEALSYGLPVVASSIPANLELKLGTDAYFPAGDVGALATRLAQACAEPPAGDEAVQQRRTWVAERYDWDRIADATLGVYEAACGALVKAGTLKA